MTDLSDILDEIDAAIDGRCAYCGAPLGATSPSAWWCGEGCHASWQRERIGLPGMVFYREPEAAPPDVMTVTPAEIAAGHPLRAVIEVYGASLRPGTLLP